MMKRFAAFVLMLSLALVLLAGCTDYADYPEYEDVTYREGGLELTLRNDMRRSESEDYEFYFTNLAGTIALTASKIDDKTLADSGLDAAADAGDYVERIIEVNEFDREMIYYSHDELRKNYSFRYSIGDEGENGVFYYVVVLGDPGNLWYVEMVCAEDDSGAYVGRFDEWRSTLRVYAE